MPQMTTEERKQRINRAVLLEAQGKLTPDQQAALDRLRAKGEAPPKLRVGQRETTVVGGEEIDTGVAQPAPTPPATMAQMVGGERKLEPGFTLNPRTGLPQAPISDAALPDLIEMAISGGPAKRLPGGVALGMAGRAVGDVARAALTNEPVPKDVGEFAESVGEAGLTSLAGEMVGRGGVKALTWAKNFLGRKIPVGKAIDFISSELQGGRITPKEFGDRLKAMFDLAEDKAGSELRNLTDELAKNPKAKIAYNKSLEVVNRRIASIKDAIQRKPNSGSIDPTTGKDTRELALRTLEDLKRQFNIQNFIGGEDLVKALKERTDAFKMGQVAKGELQGMEKELSSAIHQDIVGSLKGSGLGKEALDFEEKSTRYRSVAGLGEATDEANQLAKVFGDKRIESEAVGNILANIPEKSVQAIELLKSKGNIKALKNLKGAIFENLMGKGKLTEGEKGISGEVINAVFDADSKKVQRFIEVLDAARKDAQKGIFGKMIDFISIRGGPARIGINDSTGPILEIPAARLAKVLDNPEVLDTVIKGFSRPSSDNQAGQLARILFLAISKANRETQ